MDKTATQGGSKGETKGESKGDFKSMSLERSATTRKPKTGTLRELVQPWAALDLVAGFEANLDGGDGAPDAGIKVHSDTCCVQVQLFHVLEFAGETTGGRHVECRTAKVPVAAIRFAD